MKPWKYKIIEFTTVSLYYKDGKIKDMSKRHYHKTNSYLLMKLICLCLKGKGIYYEVKRCYK